MKRIAWIDSINTDGSSVVELTGFPEQLFLNTRELGELITALQTVHTDMVAFI